MVKSPLKYAKWPIVLYGFCSLMIIGWTLYSYYLSSGVITLSRIIWSVAGVALSILAGWWVAVKFTGTIFYRQVDHPLKDPSELQRLQTYWLNGETPAVFIGVLEHPGTYLFHILGFNKKNDLHDAKPLFPDQVRKYISTEREIFPTTHRH